ncbi:MAG TPA: TerC/Alx family metal homeostasis membrane protein [Ignavibacteriaceae bacterium]|nr:TerC/Alx family metal homeostasis membrane protein [Ignavibacteriaceae bacterium]
MNVQLILWGIFAILFVAVFAADMYVTDHTKGPIKVKNALKWTGLWILTALLFSGIIYRYLPGGNEKALQFISCYLIEYSLSVDNLFVFILIFSIMKVPEYDQPHIMKWGVLGAIVLRVPFILLGIGIVNLFHPLIYIFGALLVYTAFKMFKEEDETIEPENNILVRLVSKFFKVKREKITNRFFVKENGDTYLTLAFITLILLASIDVVFAVDSIPAIFGFTNNTFIAVTSNLFAILGLRSLFFALAGIITLFRYLKYGISFILFFVGVKMLLSSIYPVSVSVSLIVIAAALLISIFASMIFKEAKDTI